MPTVKSEFSPLDHPPNPTPQRQLSIGNTWDVLPDPSSVGVWGWVWPSVTCLSLNNKSQSSFHVSTYRSTSITFVVAWHPILLIALNLII